MGSAYELGQLICALRVATEEVGLERWVTHGLCLAELDCLWSFGWSARLLLTFTIARKSLYVL
jgi:hypothetical protein